MEIVKYKRKQKRRIRNIRKKVNQPEKNRKKYYNKSGLNEEDIKILEDAIKTRAGRRELSKTLWGFCICYLTHYLTKAPADFHPEMLLHLQEPTLAQFLAITGYRGCAKSTYAGLALPLWTAAEDLEKFIVLIDDTRITARLSIENIKFELEENELFREDYGDFGKGISKTKSWTNTGLILSNGVRILGQSRGQKIRGLRHKQYRVGLVVADDIEELKKIGKKEYRDETEKFLVGDVIPSIEEDGGRLVIIGNMLHTDGIMARIKNKKIASEFFKYLEYPLVDKNGHITWSAKFADEAALKKLENKVGRNAYLREYLLKVIPPEGQVVKEKWIKYYDKLSDGMIKSGVGVDLAISKKSSADYTAMVSGMVAYDNSLPKIYIMPHPVNKRLSALETQKKMKDLYNSLKVYFSPTFFVEDVAYQKAAIEYAQAQMIPAIGVRPGADKRARLASAAIFIQNGMVLFPRQGCEDLISQMTGFGVEENDDLADAFVYLIFGLSDEGLELPEVKILH